MRQTIAIWLAISFLVTALTAAEPDPRIPPIVELKGLKANREVFKVAKRGKPIEVRSAEDAKDFFSKEALKTLVEKVDFDQQIVLIFAWRGSGQDKLKYDVAESMPEQVMFRLIPGRTRDLRPHLHICALRSNVKWSVVGRRGKAGIR
jgi:hypothetical protein